MTAEQPATPTTYFPGQMLYVKSTEEPVTVVGTRQITQGDFDTHKFPAEYKGSGLVIIVRRPVVSEQQGMRYAFFDFLQEELETDTQTSQRIFQRIKDRESLAMQGSELIGGALKGSGVKPN